MPYTVAKRDDKYCVYRADDDGRPMGESLGCHATRADAGRQIYAIELSESASITPIPPSIPPHIASILTRLARHEHDALTQMTIASALADHDIVGSKGVLEWLGRAAGVLSQIFRTGRRNPKPPLATTDNKRTERLRILKRAFKERTSALNRRLETGELTITQWQALMKVEIRALHTSAQVAGADGWANLTDDDRRNIERTVGNQYNYLDRWAEQMKQRGIGTLDKLDNRAALYGEAANNSFYSAELAAAGLPELPAQPGDCTTECLTNCKCRWRVLQVGEDDWDCYWVLGDAEHCRQCVRRAIAWKPLMVRNGMVEQTFAPGLFV